MANTMEQGSHVVRIGGRSQKEIISKLREEATKSPAFNAVCHFFALRKRARAQVTIRSLKLTMTREKFQYDDKEYENALKFLASLGLGRVELGREGNVTALKDIRMSLQSIGRAAISRGESLERFRKVNRYASLGEPAQLKEELIPSPNDEKFPVYLSTVVKGQPVNLSAIIDLTPKDIGALVLEMLNIKNRLLPK